MPDESCPLRWLRASVLAAHLIILLATAGYSGAGDPPAAGPTAEAPAVAAEPPSVTTPAAPSPPATPEVSGTEKEGRIEKGIDATHKRLEQDILDLVIRFDNFFGNIKNEVQQDTKYQIRWSNSVRVEQNGDLKFGTTARANIRLSKINERLHLVISGEQEPEPFAPALPQDPGNPGFDRTSQRVNLVNTELRYSLLQTPDMNLFLAAGVNLKLPLEAFGRSRFQYIYHLSDKSLVRFAETLFVKSPDGPGETSEINLEYQLNPKTLLRLANVSTVSYEVNGMEWGSELSMIRELSPKSAITLTGGVYGNNNVRDWVGSYRMLARYRRNFLRSWLFYELEPQVFWPNDPPGNFTAKFAFTMRLEIIFQGSAADKDKKTGAP